jgi:uncharacterized membrane protein YdjX (TVP38/TMEM64 family)
MTQKYRVLLFIGVALLVMILILYCMGVGKYFSLETMTGDRDAWSRLMKEHYFLSVLMYTSLYTIIIACGIPASGPLTLIGGYLFGVLPGTAYALLSATLGATIFFILARTLLANMVRERYAKKLVRFQERVNSYGHTYLLSLHLLSIFPYFMIATLAALTNVPAWSFIWTATVGSLPLIMIYSFAGKQLGTVASARDILSPSIIFVLVLLALLALLPVLIRRIRLLLD